MEIDRREKKIYLEMLLNGRHWPRYQHGRVWRLPCEKGMSTPGTCFQTYSKEGCANGRCYRRNNRVSADEEARIKDFGGGEVNSNGTLLWRQY